MVVGSLLFTVSSFNQVHNKINVMYATVTGE